MAPTYLQNTWGTCKIGSTTYPRLIQHELIYLQNGISACWMLAKNEE